MQRERGLNWKIETLGNKFKFLNARIDLFHK